MVEKEMEELNVIWELGMIAGFMLIVWLLFRTGNRNSDHNDNI
jgi:hypothetical protein